MRPPDHPGSSPKARSWLAASSQDLLWFETKGSFVLFHRPSGKTHFVNGQMAELLRTVLAVPRSAAEAARCLLAQQGLPDDEALGLESYVEQLILQLDELGLVREN